MDSTQAPTIKARGGERGDGAEKIATLFVRIREICYSVNQSGRSSLAEEATGQSPFELGVYPKAQVLNRFIAKVIDLLIVAAASKLVPPVGFLPDLPTYCWPMVLGAVEVSGSGLIGLQTIVPRTREPRGISRIDYSQSSLWPRPIGVRNTLCGMDRMSGAVLSLEALLVIGNEQGRRLGDEIAKTQVLESGQLDVPD